MGLKIPKVSEIKGKRMEISQTCISQSWHMIAMALLPKSFLNSQQLAKATIHSKKNRRVVLEIRRRQWHPTLALLPGKSHGRRNLVGRSPWGH